MQMNPQAQGPSQTVRYRHRVLGLLSLLFAITHIDRVCISVETAAVLASGNASQPSRRMPDGKEWTTENLGIDAAESYCYAEREENCRRYGRLYTWSAAQRGCRSLGEGWRLPTNEEWQQMAKYFGGVRGDAEDGGTGAFKALVTGGSSGFSVTFGGRRSDDGEYARLEAHGFYWTASESAPATAWFYNFGQARFLNRHEDGNKRVALSARCVRD